MDEDLRWHTMRIGPFNSRGGNDWWNFYIRDAHGFGAQLNSRAAGEELSITAHFSGGVTASNELMGFPPLHYHHIHMAPGLTVDPRYSDDLNPWNTQGNTSPCALHNENCKAIDAMIYHHGDSQCMIERGGPG